MNQITQSQPAGNSHQSMPHKNGLFRLGGYWLKLVLQPALAVLILIGLAWLFGFVQRNYDWFSDAATSVQESDGDENTVYACSMLCVFVKAPGRCPVCGMKLQPIDVAGDPKDVYGVTIEPAARRLANIETVAALNIPLDNDIEVLDNCQKSKSEPHVDSDTQPNSSSASALPSSEGSPETVLPESELPVMQFPEPRSSRSEGSPKDIEDQVTYPLSVALQSVAGEKRFVAKACLDSALSK